MIELDTRTTTTDHQHETLPWVLPATGVHTTMLLPAAVEAALGLDSDIVAILVETHTSSITSYDDQSVRAGCGCGWVSDESRTQTLIGRELAAVDFADHLRESGSSIAWTGKP